MKILKSNISETAHRKLLLTAALSHPDLIQTIASWFFNQTTLLCGWIDTYESKFLI